MARWILLFLLFYGPVIFPAQPVQAQSKGKLSIKLKSKALVMGPKIYLGEVGVIEGANKEAKVKLDSLVLGQAAPPGESRELTLTYIKHKMRAAGMTEYIPFVKGPKSIRVSTAHVQIDKAILQNAVTQYIEGHLPPAVVDHQVEFRRLPNSIRLPSRVYQTHVTVIGSPKLRGYRNFWVEFISDGRRLRRVPVAAFVRTFEEVLVAKERISRAQDLAAAQLRQEVVETTYLSSEPLRKDHLEDLRVRVPIAPGTVLTRSHVESAPLVEAGDIVRIIARKGGVRAITIGKAQQKGGESERIRVKNLGTGKMLTAKIIGSRTVVVEP